MARSNIYHEDMQMIEDQMLELQRENERLKVEREISELELKISHMNNFSTPYRKVNVCDGETQTHETKPVRRRLLPRTPDISHLTHMPSARGNLINRKDSFDESGNILDPARFITVRNKSKASKKNDSDMAKSHKKLVTPATYDGSTSWTDYHAHFETCAEINGWNDTDKGLYLAVSLRDQAQGVYGNLLKTSHNYDDLVTALVERFAPPNQTELYRVQLRERKQKASETLSELAQDIQRLTILAYPTAPNDVRETLSKELFIDSLFSSDMRLRIKQARPLNLNDAVRHAVELEAFNRAERKQREGQGYLMSTNQPEIKESKEIAELKESVEHMRKTLDQLLKNPNYERKNRTQQHERPNYERQRFGARTGQQNRDANDAKSTRNQSSNKRQCYLCGSEHTLNMNVPIKHSNLKLMVKTNIT